MRENTFLKGLVITSSMLSLTLFPIIMPAVAEENAPAQEIGSYLTKEQFTEYNLWTNYINDYPNDAFGYVNRANIQYSVKQYQKAVEDYNKALEIDPYNADAYLKRGNCYFVMNDKAKAMLDYTNAIKSDSKMGEAYFNIGRIYYEQNDLNNALKNMSKGIAIVKDRPDYFYELGRAEYRSGNYQDAYNNFAQAIVLDNSNIDALFAQGLCALNLNNFDTAAQNFKKVLETNPNYESAQYYNGLALYQSGDFKNAIAAFDNALKIKSDDAVAYNLRGCAKELLGDKSAAKKDFKKAKSLGLKNVGLSNEAKAYFAQLKQPKVKEIVTTAVEETKTGETVTEVTETVEEVFENVQEPVIKTVSQTKEVVEFTEIEAPKVAGTFVWTDKPITPKERKILDEAALERLIREALKGGDVYGTIALLERIAVEDPHNPEHYIRLAETKLATDSYTGVIADAETAIMNGSNNPQAYYLEGLAYKKKGNRIYAYRNFALCYSADNKNPDYIYNLAEASYDIGRYPEAYELVSELLDSSLEERFPQARLLMAKTEYKMGKYYSAVDNINKYLKNNKKSSEAYVYSAFSKEALEKYDDAIKDYKKAIKYDKSNAELRKFRGDLQLSQGHPRRALHDYKKIVSLKGKAATSDEQLRVARLEEKLGCYDNAIAGYTKILQKDNLNDEVYIARANVYAKKGDKYNAISDYSTALRLDPYQAPSVYKKRGILLVQLRSYRRGAEDLTKAIKFEPENGQLYYYRALAYKALGKEKDADADYEKAKRFEAL